MAMRMLKLIFGTLGLALIVVLGTIDGVLAAETPKLDSGDTAWMLTSTALVLMMTIPGVALFYGGMVRKKNVLATIVQSFAVTCLMTVLWMIIGYSLAFTNGGGMNAFVGGLDKFLLMGMGVADLSGTIPETVFMTFQMTFAIITPALITGAIADRMKFSSMLVFLGLWMVVVYAPITHWVWGGGFLGDAGVLDFAGGTVVHINSGVAALVAAIVLGRRRDAIQIGFVGLLLIRFRSRLGDGASVEEGQHLATVSPPISGKEGKDVFGNRVKVRRAQKARIRTGKNVRKEGEWDYYADCAGRIRWEGHALHVDNVYTIPGDVDLKTGDVTHPGAVIVQKDVGEGAEIVADGDVEVYGIVEKATIKCGGSLTVRGGIVGGENCTIKVGGSLQALYIMDAHVEAVGDVEVEKEILQSVLTTDGNVLIPRGRIVGGRIAARSEVLVGQA
ncbi:MAG: DUF342 domain-containing protein, partial [Proteobacteria bacterium]|nr:DUF342 domain-containing protein [Pseudomonadota bacterium]